MKLFIKKLFLLSMTIFGHNIVASQPKISLPTIATLQEALFNVRKLILNFPADDRAAAEAYEKAQAIKLVQCAKVLYDNAREQILQALQEMDNRLAYWRYQKSHQWTYFLMKNPLKWFIGPHQDMEIEHNIEQLQSHQGELYVLLGQLAEHGNVYDHELKTVFVANASRAYAWIDELLVLLARIKVTYEKSDAISPFIMRATLLKLKLTKVRHFKNDILAEMPETKIPAHFERNWLKYGALAFLFGYGYKYVDQISDITLTSFEQAKNYALDLGKNVKEIFFPGKLGREGLIVQPANINESHSAMINFLDVMEKDKIITGDEKATIIADEIAGRAGFQTFFNQKIAPSKLKLFYYGTQAANVLGQLTLFHGGSNVEKEITGLRNIALLAPAAFVGWVAFKGYQTFVTKDYSPIRRALVDINSLFVDTTKSLDDERYGKMLYLLYNLKKQAGKMVPVADRIDFLQDLEKIESKEFDVAAKRRIVEDMFRKYSFLSNSK